MLGRIKLTFPAIRDAILMIQEENLTENMIKQFLQSVPTEDEAMLIRDYVGGDERKLKELGKAEQFFYEMLKIPRYEQRLQCIHYKMRFAERLSDVRPDIMTVLAASNMLKDNKKLTKVFEIILAVGNFMNSDSFRGGAYGFTIETLTKLGDTRSTTGKMTFLHYLAKLIDRKFPELRDLATDLSQAEKASKVSLPAVNQEMQDLNRGMMELEKELQQDDKGSADPFRTALKDFVDANHAVFDELKAKRQEMESAFKSCVEYFGEDPKTAVPETFFGIFWTFLSNLEKARKDNEKEDELRRKAEEKAAKGKQIEEKNAQVQKGKETRKSQTDLLLQSDRKGVMDDLISSLKTGDAFRGKSRTRQRATSVSMARQASNMSLASTDAEKLLAQIQAG
ncbi:Dishevelled associated activator of morphogenesis 2 [Quaeritorhiza haematococci]|nr:Dishevelled associated activator of morphogenesis 2 [Quaeritorhiza haematococci]